MNPIQHKYIHRTVASCSITPEFATANGGTGLGAALLEHFAAARLDDTAFGHWVSQEPEWRRCVRLVWCQIPDKFYLRADEFSTSVSSAVFTDHVFTADDTATGEDMDDDDTAVFLMLLCSKKTKTFYAVLLGLGSKCDVGSVLGPAVAVPFSTIVPNTMISSLTVDETDRLMHCLPMRAALLPEPSGWLLYPELDKLTDRLVSFCLRWHCTERTQRRERIAEKDESLRSQLYNNTLRFFRKASARDDVFGHPHIFIALFNIVTMAKNSRLRVFVRQQFISALRFLCDNELPQYRPSVQAEFAVNVFRLLSDHVNHGNGFGPEAKTLDLRAENGSISFSMYGATEQIGDLMWPLRSRLSDDGFGLKRGRFIISPATAVAMVPDLLVKFFGLQTPRKGKRAAVAMQHYIDRSYDIDRTCYNDMIPQRGGFYAEDRPCYLDDVAVGTPECRGLRLHSFNVAADNRLTRTPAQLAVESGNSYCVTSSSRGRVSIPLTAIAAVQHVPDEARAALHSTDSMSALANSMLRKSTSMMKHSGLSQESYRDDADKSTVQDKEFQAWVKERQREGKARQKRAGSATAAASMEEDSPSDDIEDLCKNLYDNKAMPLCASVYARQNVELGEHPKDESRMRYYAFLRSLGFENITTPSILFHMIRNVDPARFDDYYRRFSYSCPRRCEVTLQHSRAKFIENGADEAEADIRASCFPRCSTKKSNGSCPYADATTANKQSELRRKLIESGVEDLLELQAIVKLAAEGKVGHACKRQFVATRPAYGARSLHERVPPFPPPFDYWINHASEYTYLAAAHMEASLSKPRGYTAVEYE